MQIEHLKPWDFELYEKSSRYFAARNELLQSKPDDKFTSKLSSMMGHRHDCHSILMVSKNALSFIQNNIIINMYLC